MNQPTLDELAWVAAIALLNTTVEKFDRYDLTDDLYERAKEAGRWDIVGVLEADAESEEEADAVRNAMRAIVAAGAKRGAEGGTRTTTPPVSSRSPVRPFPSLPAALPDVVGTPDHPEARDAD